MNILKIVVGHEYDEDYSEFIFRTNMPKRKFYDENLKLNSDFVSYLYKNNHWLWEQYMNNRIEDITYFHEDSLDIIDYEEK